MNARRSRKLGDGNDSVMDTMTNVVAVLLIVVAVTQLGFGDAAARGRGQDVAAEVAPEALEAARAEHERLEASLAGLQARWGELEAGLPARRIELADLEAAIAELSAELARPLATPVDAAERERVEQELARLEQALAEARAALARCDERKQALVEAAQPERLAVPNWDPKLAEGRTQVRFLCRADKVFELDLAAVDAAQSAEDRRVANSVRWSPATWDATCRRVVEHFGTRDIGTPTYRLLVRRSEKPIKVREPQGTSVDLHDLRLVVELRDGAEGSTLEHLLDGTAAFQARLAQLDPAKHWVHFRVFDESIEEYLAARAVATRAGFSVGWDGYDPSEDVQSVSLILTGGSSRAAAPDSG